MGFAPGSGVSGGVSSSSLTVFYPDGRYSGSSSAAPIGSFDSGGGYAVSNGDEDGGTYEVRDGLVIFQPGEGRCAGPWRRSVRTSMC